MEERDGMRAAIESVRGEEVYPGFRWLALLLGMLGCADMQMTFLAVGPVAPEIARLLQIDLGAATMVLMSAYLGAGSVTWLLLGGWICDRFGLFVSFFLGFLCLAAPAALLPWIGDSVAGVLCARVIEGFSAGLMFPAVPAIARQLFPLRQRGLANGLINSMVAGGNSLGVFLGPIVYAAVGSDWKRMSAALSLLGWASLIFCVALYLAYNAQLPRITRERTEPGERSAFRQALWTPFSLYGIGTAFCAAWGLQCLFSLAPTYLAADAPLGAGYGAMLAGRLTLGATLIGGAVGPILGGVLIDRFFHGEAKWVFAAGFALSCVFVLLLIPAAVVSRVALLEPCLILAGLGVMLTFPTIYYMIASSYPTHLVGKMCGLWGGLGNCGGMLGVYAAGWMIRAQGGYGLTFAVQAAVSVVGLYLAVALCRAQRAWRAAGRAEGQAAD